MNKGMPNASKLLSRTLLSAAGVSGILGWIFQAVLSHLFTKGSQKILAYMDQGQMVLIVNTEEKDFDESNMKAWAIVDQGKVLTKDEMDAVDQPVIDALVKFATFNKLRRPSKNT